VAAAPAMARIVDVRARRLWDSRGSPAIEAEVVLKGARGRAIVPSAAAACADGGGRARDAARAVHSANTLIREALRGVDARNQQAVDEKLIDLDGTADRSRLGADAIAAVSFACLRACAAAARRPLWRHLAGEAPVALPVPQIQVWGGTAHGARCADLQGWMVVCTGAGSFADCLEWSGEIYRAAGERLARRGALAGVSDEGGWWAAFQSNEQAIEELVLAIADTGLEPGTDVAIALDVSARRLWRDGRYHLRQEGVTLGREAWLERLLAWCARYPIVSVEDPFARSDTEGLRAFVRAAGARVQVVGGELYRSDATRLRAAADAATAVRLVAGEAGTVTEAEACLEAARACGLAPVAAGRCAETEDVLLVHLAVGWGIRQLKAGGFARSERMAKWNEALRIEEELGGRALPFPARRLFPPTA